MRASRLTFFLRLGSTLSLWLLTLATIFSGYEIAYFGIIAGMALVALFEFFRMLDHRQIPHFKLTGMLTAAGFLVGSFVYYRNVGTGRAYDFDLAVLVLFLMIVFARQMFASMRDRDPLQNIAYTLFALLYIPWLFNFVTKILYLPSPNGTDRPPGAYYVLFLLVVTKFSDMGAYVFGSLFGRHPFAPHISPKKTWEGFVGSLSTAFVGAHALVKLLPTKLSLFSPVHTSILALLLAFAAVIGDLAESILKRSTHIKDSSGLLPGIGGSLDLIDSLLFTAPILFFYLHFVLHLS